MGEDEKFWADESFAQIMGSEEWDKKKLTFHMKHDEEMNFNCKKCQKKISAHNKDWHNEMCDDCFNAIYFPENRQVYKKRKREN